MASGVSGADADPQISERKAKTEDSCEREPGRSCEWAEAVAAHGLGLLGFG